MDPDRRRDLPSQDQSLLLEHLGIHDPSAWEEGWRSTGVIEQTTHLWPEGAHSDWLWSLGLPILTEVMRHQGQRWLLGFSALPGCGKTSLGHWLEAAAERLGLSLQVMSIDDFYFSADALDRSMQGNPWECPGPYLAVTSYPCCSRRLSNGVPVVTLVIRHSTRPCAKVAVTEADGAPAPPM